MGGRSLGTKVLQPSSTLTIGSGQCFIFRGVAITVNCLRVLGRLVSSFTAAETVKINFGSLRYFQPSEKCLPWLMLTICHLRTAICSLQFSFGCSFLSSCQKHQVFDGFIYKIRMLLDCLLYVAIFIVSHLLSAFLKTKVHVS